MIWQAYVYIYGYFFWRKIETRKVSFFKKKKKKFRIRVDEDLACRAKRAWQEPIKWAPGVVVNSYGRDWSREIVKPNLWRNSAFSDQSPTIQPSLLAPRSSQLKVSRNVPCCEKRGARNDGWRLPRFASYFLKDSLQPVGAIICRLL